MRSPLRFIASIPLIIPAILLTGCSNAGRNSAENNAENDIIKQEVILSPETQELLRRFPTPFELANMLSDAKAPFIEGLCNSPTDLSRYFTEKTKALALGVYTTDLAWCTSNDRRDDVNKYLFCTSKLSNDLGISGIYDKTLMDRANSARSRDSLTRLVSRVLSETGDFLSHNNRTQVAVLVTAGAYIEGLYIAASLLQLSPSNQLLLNAISRQKENLDKLIKITGEYNMDSNIKPVCDLLTRLKPVFTDFGLGNGQPLSPDKAKAMLALSGSIRNEIIK